MNSSRRVWGSSARYLQHFFPLRVACTQAARDDMSTQESLRSSWLDGVEGRLCGREQAKAWALREIWRSEGNGAYGELTFVSERVRQLCLASDAEEIE